MPEPQSLRERAIRALDQWCTTVEGIEVEPLTDGWLVMLRGEHKRTIPVRLHVGERTLVVQSFFMRAPDEDKAEVYAFLLRRNLRSYTLRFALHPDGDVLLVGVLPLACVTAEELDRLLGQVLAVADEAFERALRIGFASYIEREQAWRERVGLERNPIS